MYQNYDNSAVNRKPGKSTSMELYNFITDWNVMMANKSPEVVSGERS